MVGFLVAVAVWIAFQQSLYGDWKADTAPAIHALTSGDVGRYLSAEAMMGPLATLVQAPFATIGSSLQSEFQWSCIPCLLAAAALGLYLAEIARHRGVGTPGRFLIATLTLLNPLTFAALQAGHPEEILTAALAVGAVAVAAQGHGLRGGLLLGLAIASKQWAVMALFPVLLVLPRARLRSAGVAAAVVAVLMLPGLIAAPDSFMNVQSNAASGGSIATIWSVWFPLTGLDAVAVGHGAIAEVHRLPAGIEPLTHPLIVATMFLLPLAICLRRGRLALNGTEAMALLALLALLRCLLDPLDNSYYHEPLLLALFGWDALSGDRLPLRGIAGTAVAVLFTTWSERLGDLDLFNAAYLVVLLGVAAAVLVSLMRGRRSRLTAPATAAAAA